MAQLGCFQKVRRSRTLLLCFNLFSLRPLAMPLRRRDGRQRQTGSSPPPASARGLAGVHATSEAKSSPVAPGGEELRQAGGHRRLWKSVRLCLNSDVTPLYIQNNIHNCIIYVSVLCIYLGPFEVQMFLHFLPFCPVCCFLPLLHRLAFFSSECLLWAAFMPLVQLIELVFVEPQRFLNRSRGHKQGMAGSRDP